MAGKLVSDQPAEQAGKLVSDQLPEKTKKSASDQPLRSLNDTQRKIIRMCDMYLQRPSGARSRAACGRDRLAAGGGRRRPPRVAARSRARHCGATSAGLSQTANYLFIQQIECSNLIRRQRQEHQEFEKARLAQLELDYGPSALVRRNATSPRCCQRTRYQRLLDTHHRQNQVLLGHLSAAELESITIGTVRSEIQQNRRTMMRALDAFCQQRNQDAIRRGCATECAGLSSQDQFQRWNSMIPGPGYRGTTRWELPRKSTKVTKIIPSALT
jgi:hypothetical protein